MATAITMFRGFAPQFIIGNWESLNVAQQRIFITYVVLNYGGGADPAEFAAELWNDSSAAANSGHPGTTDRLLELSQLTTYIGVTSLWTKRQVIDQVTLVSHINGDQPQHNFRLYGELKPGGGEVIKRVFDHDIAGSGHGEYSVSRREQGVWGQPNGQFSMTEDLLRFDGDVDYRRILNPGHNTKENSDIRAFDRSTPHLERHIKRYGPVPITMHAFDSTGRLSPLLLARYQSANRVSDYFIGRFEAELSLNGIYEELFTRDAVDTIKASGFFEGIGLTAELAAGLDPGNLKAVFIGFMDFYYLYALYEMNRKNLASGQELESSATNTSLEAEFRGYRYLRALGDAFATDDSSVRIGTVAELELFRAELTRAAQLLRERIRDLGLNSELYRENAFRINKQRQNPFRVLHRTDLSTPETYVIENGVYIIIMTEREGRLRVCNLGLGN